MRLIRQGKGFAVVAEEVGNLARMSGHAAGEISTMLDGSTRRVREIVEMMGSQISSLVVESNSVIQEGKRVANECNASLGLLSTSVGDMTRTIQTQLVTGLSGLVRGENSAAS